MNQLAVAEDISPAREMIAAARLELAAVPDGERLAAYQAQISQALETRFLTTSVEASFASCYVGALHVIHAVCAPRQSERTAALIARDRHDGVSIQLALSGHADGYAGGRRVFSRPDTIMVLDFGQPFVITDREPRDIINVAIPRAIIGRHVTDPRVLHGRVLEPGEAGLLAALLRALAARVADLPLEAGPPLADAIIELTLLSLGYDPRGARRHAANRHSALIARAQRLIDGRLGSSDLSPEWLATKLNLSRSDLYNLFAPNGGVARYIWRRRLEAARDALLDPGDDRRIGQIAFACGFNSEAHFSRAYRTTFGMTPSAQRRAAP